jgi:nicotinamide-nucleotide amidase
VIRWEEKVFDDEVLTAARRLLDICRTRKLLLATAESCTGGLIAGALTEIAGSSDVVERGFVTYSNAAKAAMLGVPQELILRHGAVSEEVAKAMAEGALAHSPADLAVSVTGVAGPGGGSAEKPVGLVHFGCAARGRPVCHRERRFGDVGRGEVRRLTVLAALALLEEAVSTRSA